MSSNDLSPLLVLAALERAARHDARGRTDVAYSVLVQHLGLPMGSATGRRLRPRLRELLASGLVSAAKRHGVIVYGLTPTGQRHLNAAGAVELPESPQHQAWRVAHDAAAGRIRGFRDDLRALLRDGETLLHDDAAESEKWFLLGERLGRACARLGSATHCLQEWAEPNDDSPDVDVGARRVRRNIRLWE